MRDILYLIFEHPIATLFLLAIVFEGLASMIRAWRGREEEEEDD